MLSKCYIYLPEEVVAHLLSFLCLSDRKVCSQVCWTWYYASRYPKLMQNVVVDIPLAIGRSMLGELRLMDTNSKLRERLTRLSFVTASADLTPNLFLQFLVECPNLSSVDVRTCNGLFYSGKSLLPADLASRHALTSQLAGVRHLGLGSLRHLNDQGFNELLQLFSGLESLDLSGSSFRQHVAIENYGGGVVFTLSTLLNFVETRATCLTALDLSHTTLSNDSLAKLGEVCGLQLEQLRLENCRDISDAGLKRLFRKQSKLRLLSISGCVDVELKDEAASDLNGMCKLHTLLAARCLQLLDNVLLKLPSRIGVLDVSSCCRLTAVTMLRSLPYQKLSHLCLNNCSVVDDVLMISLCDRLADTLCNLELAGCQRITDKSLTAISQHLIGLLELSLAWLPLITSTNALKNLTRLRILDISHCSKLTDEMVATSLQLYELQQLNLSGNRCLADKTMHSLSHCAPSLEILDISQTSVSDVGLGEFLHYGTKRLRRLKLSGCDFLTLRIFEDLQHRDSLRWLDVTLCNGFRGSDASLALDNLERKLSKLCNIQRDMF